MKIKSILITFALVLAFVLSACSPNALPIANDKNSNKVRPVRTASTDDVITVGQMADFLRNKKEHYPLSDEFAERYQQTSGGYLDYAKQCGIEVDRQKHSPNQKWHFFESWLGQSLADGSLTLQDDAKSRVYTKLLCPELLLWIYEACGVNAVKVKNAFDVAVKGKVEGTGVATIAKNMRGCVAWEDLAVNFKDRVVATAVRISNTTLSLNAGEQTTLSATVEPSNTTETPLWTVVDGNDVVTITQSGNKVTVLGIKEGSATVRVSYNSNVFAHCTVTVIDTSEPTIVGVVNSVNLLVSQTHALQPALSKGNGTFTFQSDNPAVATVDASGVISAISVGNANVTITCVEQPTLTKTVAVTVSETSSVVVATYTINFDLGDRVTALRLDSAQTVMDALTLASQGNSLVTSLSQIDSIFAGANGGRGETAWYVEDAIKIGSTSLKGSITFELSSAVNYVKITGYVHGSGCKIRVGDSTSTDWADGTADNKTTTISCSPMTVANKDSVASAQTSQIEVTFASASSVTIATTVATPLYITSIEFGFNPDLA